MNSQQFQIIEDNISVGIGESVSNISLEESGERPVQNIQTDIGPYFFGGFFVFVFLVIIISIFVYNKRKK